VSILRVTELFQVDTKVTEWKKICQSHREVLVSLDNDGYKSAIFYSHWLTESLYISIAAIGRIPTNLLTQHTRFFFHPITSTSMCINLVNLKMKAHKNTNSNHHLNIVLFRLSPTKIFLPVPLSMQTNSLSHLVPPRPY
jgi:hypothetical protein